GRVLGKMRDAGNSLNIIILDACRNNPFDRGFRTRGPGGVVKGLAKMDVPAGSIIGYATAPDALASDGKGRNGLYTRHLLRHIKTRGLSIEQALKKTRIGVAEESTYKQIPWVSTSLLKDFYFRPSGKPPGSDSKKIADGSTIVTQPEPLPEPRTGGLRIKTVPSGAMVRIDGSNMGNAPLRITKMKPRDVKIRASLGGYKDKEESVLIEKGIMTQVTMYLDRDEPEEKPAVSEKPSAESPSEPKPGTVWKEPVTGMEFVRISKGCFQMGQTGEEKSELIKAVGNERYKKSFSDEVPRHKVCVSAFDMGKYEVTVGQWRKFVREEKFKTDAEKGGGAYVWTGKWEKKEGTYWDNPGFEQNDSHPVTCVSWNDVQAFIRWLNRKNSSKYEFRLPTEAEWEYACRAGTTTAFSFGDCLSTDQANYNGNYPTPGCSKGKYREKTVPVKSFSSNAWGLYNMHGNVFEWCQDWYGDYPSGSVTDPSGPQSGSNRVIRGGSWLDGARYCRSANRSGYSPGRRNNYCGFRLVVPAGQH
ncbi:SUMF1/EgtB/PvdO family nonheme iron enzyme, partial [Desulfococcaceae bacterium HSG8]|nr:SUMF1/EgtB/PvdO family nonheme iron enzyme [Desulfococcaceae bacterium HSG8]